jgi:peroxiredoxin
LLAVNVGEQKSKVVNFIKSKNLSFRVLLDTESQVADEYDLLGVPTYFVINKSGQVVFSGNHFPEGKIKDLISK